MPLSTHAPHPIHPQQRALPRTHRPAPPSKASTSRAWFDLPAPEITDDVKRDLRLLRLRSAYDPTRHYKSLGKGKFPKNFAFGTVIQGPGEFFSGMMMEWETDNSEDGYDVHDGAMCGMEAVLQENCTHSLCTIVPMSTKPINKPINKHRTVDTQGTQKHTG